MSGNATHFIIHNHFDSSSLHLGMICCVILALVILIGIFYVIIHSTSTKCRRPRKSSRTKRSKRRPETSRAVENIIDDASSCNVNPQASSTATDQDEDNNPNAESIPLSAFQSRTTDQRDRASKSSAGLYDVLFPDQHGGEILYDTPRKLMTFAGQVYASNGDRADPETGPSGSGLNCEAASGSLEWDHFLENSPVATESSDIEVEVDPTKIYDVCWV